MTFNLWTFLFEVVNFVVLAYILHRLLYKPLRAAIDKRRAEVERARTEADAARADALALQKQLESQLADLEKQRQEMIQKARVAAEEERKRLIAESEQAIDRRQQEARAAIDRQREDAMRSLAGELRAAAADLVERLLKESAGASLQGQLARRLLDTLAEVPESQKTELRQQWTEQDGALLESAAALDAKATQEVSSAVEALIGRKVKLAVEVKPALVAGARLRIAGHVWDASLAGQLDAIKPRQNGSQAP